MKNLKARLIIPVFFTITVSNAQTAADTSLVIREAVVSAKKGEASGGTGSIVVPAGMVKGSLALLGEADVLKTIQLLPGIQAGNEGLSGIYVRGGGSDENLILLDGVPVHCQGHLLGLFSPFQSEMLEEVTIHKGAFPARYGGRASSVLEIRTVQPQAGSRTRVCLGAGTLSDKLHLEGNSPGGRISWSVSGRGTHTLLMDGVLKAFKIPANLYFHDLHAKASGHFSDKNSFSVSFFDSKDKIYYKEDGQTTDFSWGTRMVAAGWKRGWSPDLSSEIILATSGYCLDTGSKMAGSRREALRTGLEDLIAKADLLYSGIRGHNIRCGVEAIRHVFRPEADFDNGVAGQVRDLNPASHETGYEAAIYMEDRIKATNWLTLNTGLRLTAFSAQGKTRICPEPRLSFSAGKATGPSVKIGYSRVSQHIHQLSSPVAILPVDMIVPVTKSIGPEISDQVSAGISLNAPKGIRISIEAYWKKTEGVLEYKDGIDFIDNFDTWEEDVASGTSRSRGIEFHARKSEGKTTGWIGYTLSKSERRFAGVEISGGEWFPSRHDCRHSGTAVIERKLGHGWEAGATWTYSTGGALTIPEKDGSMAHGSTPLTNHGSTPLTNRGSTPLTNHRGNYRLPPSHRLDLGMTNHKPKRRGERIWSLGVYNAYNRKNPNLVFPVTGDEDEGSGPPENAGKVTVKKISFLPVIPSVGYTRVF